MDNQTYQIAVQAGYAPPKPYKKEQWEVAKIVLRSCSLTLAVVLLVVGFANVFDIIAIVFGFFPAAWDTAEFITLCVRGRKRGGITPKAHVGVHLVIWLGAAACLGLQSWFLVEANIGSIYQKTPRKEINFEIVYVTFYTALLLLHFTLFVRACVEVDRASKERQITRVIMELRQREQNVVKPDSLYAPTLSNDSTAYQAYKPELQAIPPAPRAEMPAEDSYYYSELAGDMHEPRELPVNENTSGTKVLRGFGLEKTPRGELIRAGPSNQVRPLEQC